MMHRHRPGLTLLEVIVSMAIFLMSIAAIWQLANIGGERALDVSLRTRTSLRCQGKLAEIMIGAETNTSGSYANFEGDDKDLQWRADVAEDPGNVGLKIARVWVKAELNSGKKVESMLAQKFLDPAIRGTTFDLPNPPLTPGTATPDTPDPATPSTGGATGKTGGATGKTGGATGKTNNTNNNPQNTRPMQPTRPTQPMQPTRPTQPTQPTQPMRPMP